ncbi:hypothetical protein ACFQPA_18850 [Halomarina halobia]|uniref:DUF2206 domain-containing protein n=1 Tax=Halomarina halobia TaxID=3033386 RepID=A0ABD6ACH7_9EURY|nr:hypothetical protein [Halomarina sp. PSR21]
MDMRVSLGLSISVFSIAILYSHTVNSLFPILPVGIVIAVGIPLFAVLRRSTVDRRTAYAVLSMFVLLSTLHKVYIFSFPASLIGYDPGLYVQQIDQLIEANRVSAIDETEISFYSKAPFFLLLVAAISFVGGVTPEAAMIVYPVIVGVMYPVSAFAIIRRIAPVDPLRTATVGTAPATVAALSLHYGFHPLAQTLAVVLWLAFVISVTRYYVHRTSADFLVIMLLLMAMLSTHKVPGVLVVGTFLLLFVGTLSTHSVSEMQDAWRDRSVRSLLLLTGVTLFAHWTFIAEFIDRVLFRIALLFSPTFLTIFLERVFRLFGGGAASGGPASEAIVSPLVVFLMNNLYAVVLFPLAAIGWVALFVRHRSDPATRVLLTASALISFLVVLGYVQRVAVNPRRFTFFAEVLLLVLVAVVIGRLVATGARGRTPVTGAIIFGLLLVLLSTQVFATVALPNHPVSSPDGLTAGEQQAKRFTHAHVPGEVHTDFFYAVKPPADPSRSGESEKYISMGEELLNQSENLSRHDYVLYRERVDTHRTPGKTWRVTWDAQRYLDGEYSRIYSNNDVTLYTRRGE